MALHNAAAAAPEPNRSPELPRSSWHDKTPEQQRADLRRKAAACATAASVAHLPILPDTYLAELELELELGLDGQGRRRRLSPTARALYGLVRRVVSLWWIGLWMGKHDIAAKLARSPSSVKRAIRELERHKLIVVTRWFDKAAGTWVDLKSRREHEFWDQASIIELGPRARVPEKVRKAKTPAARRGRREEPREPVKVATVTPIRPDVTPASPGVTSAAEQWAQRQAARAAPAPAPRADVDPEAIRLAREKAAELAGPRRIERAPAPAPAPRADVDPEAIRLAREKAAELARPPEAREAADVVSIGPRVLGRRGKGERLGRVEELSGELAERLGRQPGPVGEIADELVNGGQSDPPLLPLPQAELGGSGKGGSSSRVGCSASSREKVSPAAPAAPWGQHPAGRGPASLGETPGDSSPPGDSKAASAPRAGLTEEEAARRAEVARVRSARSQAASAAVSASGAGDDSAGLTDSQRAALELALSTLATHQPERKD